MNRSIRSSATCALLLLAGFTISAPVAAEPFRVQGTIPYAEDNRIARNITSECTELGVKLSDFLVKFAKKKGIEVKQVGELNPADAGRNLVIEITDAVSRGNAFIGHQKYMEARAELFVDGESKGEQFYHRDSMGGFGAGYKSSCSVLGRTSKALGKDFSVWLQELEAAGL
ncbi:MAG: hypothetical protein AB8B93_05415 [Pseudomonadales bacterium]